MRGTLAVSLMLLAPAALFAESAMPSLGYTGAPADHSGQNCSTCHGSFGAAVQNSSALTVTIGDYNPYLPQMIRIVVEDPMATIFGFQMTIREVSDETQSAGTFAPSSSNVQVVCDDGSRFGSAAPCTTARQFAEQSGPQRTSAGTGMEFDVQWTPPAQEVGKLHVYVAAVAGNGDGTPSGDRVYTFTGTISNVGACSLTRQPTVQTVVNAASFQAPFSPNELVSIFGTNFQTSGVTRTAGLGDFVNGGFPTELSCISVQATGPGIAQPVLLPIVYVQEGLINAQMPAFTGTGMVTLKVVANPGISTERDSDPATFTTQLQPFAPAFFLFPNSTSIAAQFAGTANIVANPSVVAGARPALPGDFVTLYGTGFGDTNPSFGPGQLATGTPRLTTPITVTIGNFTLTPAQVQYAGLSPGSISGLYQINVQIPTSTPNGDIPVTILIDSSQTPMITTIPVQQ